MNIITISREFGSGGRELGKRLSDALNVPCYDDEIIEAVAEKHGLSKDYVAHMSEKDFRAIYPTTIGRRFSGFRYHMHPATNQSIQFAVAQQEVIRELADRGDCVVVGRCAGVILSDLNPFSLFVYASQESKLARCRSRAKEGEHAFLTTARHEYLLSLPLTKEDIKAEALNILCKFQDTREPNSPNGTHYMAQISPDFLARAKTKDTDRLMAMLPFQSLSFSTLEGRRGTYALITKDENRFQKLVLRKPSVRKRLQEKSDEAAAPKPPKKSRGREQER